MNKLLKQLQKLLASLQSLLAVYRRKSLSDFARQRLGKDFTNDSTCSDELSCAYAVSTILKDYLKLRGEDFPIIFGTDLLDNELSNHMYFKRIRNIPEDENLPFNSVIVSPRTPTVHGHTGIIDTDGMIMNNNSATGLWVKSYGRMGWRDTFVHKKGLVTRVYQVLI